MSRFGKTLFSGSRFIFWSLAPLLALCAVVLPVLVARWTVESFLGISLVEALLIALILSLFNPRRFRWATRCVTGIVFCLFLGYAVDEIFLSGTSPARAISAFVAIGLPCLWYTIFGRFSLRGDESEKGEPEPSDKLDAVDFDI